VTFYQNFVVVTFSVHFLLSMLLGAPTYLLALPQFFLLGVPFGLLGGASPLALLPVIVLVAIELTAYFLIAEALTNAYKHADASRVGLAVWAAGGGIVVEISDDGRGGAAARPGSGLSGLHDRMAAVGGTLTVISPAGRGTRLTALLPVEDLCV